MADDRFDRANEAIHTRLDNLTDTILAEFRQSRDETRELVAEHEKREMLKFEKIETDFKDHRLWRTRLTGAVVLLSLLVVKDWSKLLVHVF